MEKPNPELYNSEGHYEADLEKYNEMKNMSAEDIKLGILIDKGNGKLFSLSEQEIIFAAMEEYAAQFKAEQSKPVLDVWDEFVKEIVAYSHNDKNVRWVFTVYLKDLKKEYQITKLQTQPSQCAGVWVKARLDNLPQDGKVVCVKYETHYAQKWRYDSSHAEMMKHLLEKYPEKVFYYLDESQQQAVSDEENLEVWDCSDIAVKFNNWVRDESYIWDDKIKKYVAVWNNYAEYTTSALFSYWFNEIYNKK